MILIVEFDFTHREALIKKSIMEISFATNNLNKIKEIAALLEGKIKLLSLKDVGCEEELPENQKTLEGNSLQKAEYVCQNYNVDCFADDTGLEVIALDGEPGVYSARYAGEERDSVKNMMLLLKNLEDKENRKAQFRTVISLCINGKMKQFEGVVKGTIATEFKGDKGFGYDPIFIPDGYETTFAEMSLAEKNKISHRGIAVQKLVDYLMANA